MPDCRCLGQQPRWQPSTGGSWWWPMWETPAPTWTLALRSCRSATPFYRLSTLSPASHLAILLGLSLILLTACCMHIYHMVGRVSAARMVAHLRHSQQPATQQLHSHTAASSLLNPPCTQSQPAEAQC